MEDPKEQKGEKKSQKEKSEEEVKEKLEETEEKIDEAIEEARRVESKTERLFFLTRLKKISIVLGGALLFVGFLLILGVFLVSFDLLNVGALIGTGSIGEKHRILLTITFSVQGSLDILGGLLLAGE